MDKAFLKVVFSELVRIVTAPLRLMPIKGNRVLFTGLTGGNVYDYSCNPKYLYEYMRDNYPDRFDYVWAVGDIDRFSFLKDEGVRLVKHFSPRSFHYLLTSKVIITNGSYAPWFPFRKKQYVINTWHGGGAYKKVENGRPGANWATRRRAEFCANNIDLFLASCKVQEDQMIRTTYQYKGEVLRAGTPRNDKLVNGDIEDMVHRVRDYYNIPNDGRIVLYAPTYREPSTPVIMDSEYVLEQLSEKGDKWYFLSRYHRYQLQDTNLMVTGDKVIQVEDYPDMQELLCAADILITDYSSCVWDYAFLKRPCFLFVPDIEEYVAKTGFYVGIDEWPFPKVRNVEGLIELINNIMYNDSYMKSYEEAVEEHLKRLGSYESGKARQFVSDIILKRVEG